ncbi:hypothetical protein PV392_14730 [Streptomyces sp. ME03-5709C]|nr:hypothetical protein [Streptomyces sp. ME03-5709C]
MFALAAATGHEEITVDVAAAVLGLPRRHVITALEQPVDCHLRDIVAPGVHRRRLVPALAWPPAQLHDRAGCETVPQRIGRSPCARQQRSPTP